MSIPFDFEFYQPETLTEAKALWHDLAAECKEPLSVNGFKKKPLYYAGGTEIISKARVQTLKFDALIDLKKIPECNILGINGDNLIIGSCKTLAKIAESGLFPLLGKTVKRIADHTIQGKITLGGNLFGSIKYREACLPLLITDCTAVIMTEKGPEEVSFRKIFDGKMKLSDGDFLVQIKINKRYLNLPYAHVKKTKIDKIDYPLITMVSHKDGQIIRAAITGYGSEPTILPENLLNEPASPDERIKSIIKNLDKQVENDLAGSSDYKKFVLGNILEELFAKFSGKKKKETTI